MTEQAKTPHETTELRETLLRIASDMASNAIAGSSSVSTEGFMLVCHLLREAEAHLADFSALLRTREAEIAGLEDDIQVAEARVITLEAEIARLAQIIHEHESGVENLHRVIAAAEARADAAEQEIADYERAFSCCREHTPDVWEGDGTCVVCEGEQLAASRARDRWKLGDI